MGISAAELIGLVKIEGADRGIAQILGVGKAFDSAGGGPLNKFQQGLSLMGFGLSNVGTSGVKSGLAIRDAAVQMGGALWQVAGIATLVGGAIAVGIGVISVKAAADFQQGLNRLVTGAGDVTDNMKLMGQAILGVSTDTGVMTGPLLSSMYQIISAGQRGAQAENTLAVAAKGSVTEQAKVVDVAKALTTAMTDYGTKTFNATQFMNGYTRATQLGKITLEELSNSMGPILPLAQNLGIKFADVAGAMSTMTNAGIPAERAATSLRFLFQSLENPTHKASTAMKDFGLDSVKVGNELKVSLPGALQMVYNAAKKAGPEGSVPFNRAVSDMIGGQRSLQAYLALTGTHLSTFKSNTQAIAGAMNASKTGVLGWATAQGNFNVQMDRGKAALNVLAITVGQQLLPGLTKMMGVIVPLIGQFTSWLVSSGALQKTITVLGGAFNILGTIVGGVVHFFQQNEVAMAALKATLIVAAGVIGGVMVFALGAAAVAAWGFTIALLANPITWIVVGIIAAITGIILAITHWGQIMAWIGGIFSWLGTLAHNVFGNIGSFVGGVFSGLGTTVHNKLTDIKNSVGSTFSLMGSLARDKATDLKNSVGGAFSSLGTHVHDAMTAVKNHVGDAFNWMYQHNTYWKQIVDGYGKAFSALGTAVHGTLTWIKNTVGSIFSAIGTFIHDKLTEWKNFFGNIFFLIGTTVHNKLTELKNTVGSVFSLIGSLVHDKMLQLATWLYGIWESIKNGVMSKVNNLKNLVGTAFSALGSLIHDKMVQAWNNLVSFLSGWPAQAFNWGRNFVQGLINGIGSMFSALGGAVSNLLGQLARVAGFHSDPPEGPAKDASTWMPNLVNMWVSGLTAGKGKMNRAVNDLISPLALNAQASLSLTASGAGLSGSVARSVALGSASTQQIIVQSPDIYLDGQRLTQKQMPYIVNAIRFATGARF